MKRSAIRGVRCAEHPGLRCAASVYGLLPFCKPAALLVSRFDCTRISGLLVELYHSGHNGLFARLFLIGLSCSLAHRMKQVLQTPVRPVFHYCVMLCNRLNLVIYKSSLLSCVSSHQERGLVIHLFTQ